MTKIVLDTNVYISGILFKGKPREILNLARMGKVEILISEKIINEIERVLRLKFKRTTFEIFLILTGIRNITTFVSPILKISEIKNDEPDNRVLECAIEGKANYIISGDKHLLSLKKYKEIEILNAGEFLNRFRSD
ncbi:putative toxin-antitoxin system toxin component, PIN family [Candidatus Aminicenantes bacterium AC-708-M15]|jgi:putative PIN family toxin of toxin-antitoxin system|nr:putative toxin-antitoxin system toxin component, PIN family [Candidatus Aminicenantes bacterium AC-708-M15]MCP2606364.1 putative toxin-antitoxin system toxin component, PIN family [Candidatus Aminicenantes bacterium AC-708-I09]MCP2618616.1 putative toxin-antitoxin system toxin component, PIN family [Candidatus Aminicenantes bacterium AC-335-A11]